MAIQNGLPSVVKSVQRGTTICPTGSSPVNVTITAVKMDKAFVNLNGATAGAVQAVLTTSTNIAVTAASNGVAVSWEVVEFL